MDKSADQLAASLDSHETNSLRYLWARPRPMVPCDVARLEGDGLVRFVRETRAGATLYAITQLGRDVLCATKGGRHD